ncbi:hypothetical protein MMPV_002193 [Pyropia vietnamensis]
MAPLPTGRVISQATFDEAVADTADLFGLGRSAAAAEVVAQFRASGVTDWKGLDVSGASGARGREGGEAGAGNTQDAAGDHPTGGADRDATGRGRGGAVAAPSYAAAAVANLTNATAAAASPGGGWAAVAAAALALTVIIRGGDGGATAVVDRRTPTALPAVDDADTGTTISATPVASAVPVVSAVATVAASGAAAAFDAGAGAALLAALRDAVAAVAVAAGDAVADGAAVDGDGGGGGGGSDGGGVPEVMEAIGAVAAAVDAVIVSPRERSEWVVTGGVDALVGALAVVVRPHLENCGGGGDGGGDCVGGNGGWSAAAGACVPLETLAAVATALRTTIRGDEAVKAAVEAPLSVAAGVPWRLGGGDGTPTGLDAVAKALVMAAAAAVQRSPGGRPAALATTALTRTLLTADDASTPVSGVFGRARVLAGVPSGPPRPEVGGASPPPLPPVLAALVDLVHAALPGLPGAAPAASSLPSVGSGGGDNGGGDGDGRGDGGGGGRDPPLAASALATLRTLAIADATCAMLTPSIPVFAGCLSPPRAVTVVPAAALLRALAGHDGARGAIAEAAFEPLAAAATNALAAPPPPAPPLPGDGGEAGGRRPTDAPLAEAVAGVVAGAALRRPDVAAAAVTAGLLPAAIVGLMERVAADSAAAGAPALRVGLAGCAAVRVAASRDAGVRTALRQGGRAEAAVRAVAAAFPRRGGDAAHAALAALGVLSDAEVDAAARLHWHK